jgi:hypothetical protein
MYLVLELKELLTFRMKPPWLPIAVLTTNGVVDAFVDV